MRWKMLAILLLVMVLMIGILLAQEKKPEFPVVKGPYLGQKPPGMVPQIFAPGIISTDMQEGSS